MFISAVLTLLILSFASLTSADGVTKRVKFVKGKSSATLSGTVLRGDRDTYIVGARAEQTMSIRITSGEDNAVFQVQGPDGEYLQDAGEEDDARQVTNILPFDGDYKIIVGGTRGNAKYRLTVSIK